MDDDYEQFSPEIREDLKEMVACEEWYESVLSPGLTRKEKGSLFRRISRYWGLKDTFPDENSPSDFPELGKYWKKERISGLELYTILRHLDGDLRP